MDKIYKSQWIMEMMTNPIAGLMGSSWSIHPRDTQ